MCNWLEPLFTDGIQAGESSEFQTTHNFLSNEYTTTVDGIWDVGLYRDPPTGYLVYKTARQPGNSVQMPVLNHQTNTKPNSVW